MKKLIAILSTVLALAPAAPQPARADSCAAAAQRAAAQMGAQVLSARTEGGACVVTLRIPGQGGQPPRVETLVL